MLEEIKKIDQLLGNPDYSLTQYNLFEGNRIAGTMLNARYKCWWERYRHCNQAIKISEQLVGIEYVPLPNYDIVAEPLISQFNSAVDEWKKILPENRPNIKVAKLNATYYQDVDQKGKEMYVIKSMIGSVTGYGSNHIGLTPHYSGRLLGKSVWGLKRSKIVIAGVGPGDIFRFSLPHSKKIVGVDISDEMTKIARDNGVHTTYTFNVSYPDGWNANQLMECDVIIADYFLDITVSPVHAIMHMLRALKLGGKLMITILFPIDQVGPDSKKVKNGLAAELPFEIRPSLTVVFEKMNDFNLIISNQDIGNTGNPWSDFLKLIDVCKKLGAEPRKFTVTSYAQYDCGR